MVGGSDDRWVEVTPSQFPYEAEGLALIRAIMPDESPYRAWCNFEFRDNHGKWHEVDLLLLGRGQFHLIELKYYSGVLRGDDHRWLRDGKRAEDSPLKLARRKAQYLATKLKDELRAWATETGVQIPNERDVIPFVQESVFLHHERQRCELSASSAQGLYGLDGHEDTSNLPPISDLVLQPPGRRAIGTNQELILAKLLKRIGLVQRRERTAGSWVIKEQALAEGDGWQDWLASHQVARQERARIRFQVTRAGAPDSERQRIRKVAEHEFRVMSRLQHDGLLRPRDFVDSDLGAGLVYDYDDSWQPLDLWMAAQTNGVPLATQLSIVRQVGEALQYAHRNKVVHRGLTPRAVWVRDLPGTDGDVKVRLGDWQGSGVIDTDSHTRTFGPGVTSLMRGPGAQPGAPAQSDTPGQAGAPGNTTPDPDRWLTEAFLAPEGAWNATADRVRLDVFGVGALAFYLVAAKPAADTAQALGTRLREQGGLDLSVDVPQVSPALRTLVLKATNPAPAQRTGDVGTFLGELATVERQAADADTTNEDPLDASPGTLLAGRFRLERRLGQGSTAVGLLVTDLQGGPASAPTKVERVLKVALHDDAATRLSDEADVLRGLDNPRLVRLVEGPITVGGRKALLLESAGTETLAEALRGRDRLSIDLLQRYGTDLLDALVALDKAGVDHRDIKPSNLGVRENRGDRTKHLVLFDFSLTKAAASATSAGTPPYLDPFLTDRRGWDSAAERYAAAVVLFEMATGRAPVYGDDPDANPAAVPADVTVTPEMFDPSLAEHLVEFFTDALARDVAKRQHTAEELRTAWAAIFATDATTEPDESADRLAAAATLATPLPESGLTARALSALEPYAAKTVGDLLTVDPVRLSRLQGVADATRKQISARIKQWRARLGDVAAPKDPADRDRLTLEDAGDLLLQVASDRGRSKNRAGVVRLILGIGTDLDAFATNAQLGANLPDRVTGARVSTLLATLQEAWATDPKAQSLLDHLVGAVAQRLTDLGDVATIAELTEAVHGALAGLRAAARDDRLAEGLLRIAVDRVRALDRADAADQPITWRRRGSIVVAIAHDAALLDIAEALGREADQLVGRSGTPTDAVIPSIRASQELRQILDRTPEIVPAALRDTSRVVRLAAGLSTHAAASGANELYHRDLSHTAALAHTFAGYGGLQALTPKELRERVEARFPTLPRLPERPRLDELVTDAHLGLVFDDTQGVYRGQQGRGDTTGLQSRVPTTLARETRPVESGGAVGHRLDQSVESRSFLALGVTAMRAARLVDAVEHRYAAQVVDLTGVLIEGLRENAEKAGIAWDLVRAADAEPVASQPGRGLRELVRRSWDHVQQTIDEALADDTAGPVVITEASPLARYENVELLARWTDLGTSRGRAVWLVVPQTASNQGATLDGRPVPLASPGQYLALDADAVDDLARATVATAEKES